MATNGNGHLSTERFAALGQTFAALQSVLESRMGMAGQLGMMFEGLRDVYAALGWKQTLSYSDYKNKVDRQDLAGRIVDLPADTTWREGFELQDDDNPDTETALEKAWQDLDRRLGVVGWLTKLDRVAGIGEYGVLYLGFRGQDPAQEFQKARPDDLVHLRVFSQDNALVSALEPDPSSERFGLPLLYDLTTVEQTGLVSRGRGSGYAVKSLPRSVHWSRCIHVAEGLEESLIYGRPRLQRVYNLLDVLQLVVGASGEAFWRGARPRYHLDVDKDFSGALNTTVTDADGQQVTLRQAMGDELTKLIHGFQDFIRTSGSSLTQLAPGMGDPSSAATVALDLISASTGIPKRILLGSERGELASSQDATEWAHRVAERQVHFAEPVIVRPFIDRLIEAGVLPEPSGGDYDVVWPDITGPSADQRAALAEHVTSAEAKHAQAEMLGKPSVTRNELRELLGLDPIAAMDEEVPGETPPLPSKPAPAPVVVHPPGAPGQPQVGPDGKPLPPGAPPQEPPAPPEQPAKAAEAPPFVEADRSDADLRVNALFATIMAAVNAATDRIFGAATMDSVRAALVDFGQRMVTRYGRPDQEFDLATQAAVEYMRTYGGSQVAGIGDTTRELLRDALTEGLRAGETQQQLARRVRVYFRDASAGRARTIALTEAHSATQHGAFVGMAQAGVTAKVWRTQGDEKVRPTHVELDGQIRHLGDPFEIPSTGATAMRPGGFEDPAETINCRCVMEPAGNMPPGGLAANAGDGEWPRRLAVHERRVLAAVRRGLRAQEAAVLAVLAGGGAPAALTWDESKHRVTRAARGAGSGSIKGH